jgi:hypothetical protein
VKLGPRQTRWAAALAAGLIRLLAWTGRWRERVPDAADELLDSGRPVILAFWHGRLLMIPLAYLRRGRRNIHVLISEHGDGELISRAIAHFGFDSVRGSSRRGALKAMRELIRRMRDGGDFAFTPDGPRGPRYEVQPGVVDFARRTGYPVLPVTYSARWAKVFGSWDRFMVPWPFTRGELTWGEPLWVGKAEETETARERLEVEMRSLTEGADRRMGRSPC